LIDEAVAANAPAGTNARKIGDLYKSFMDEAGIEAKGMAPLEPHLRKSPRSRIRSRWRFRWARPCARMWTR